MAEVPVERREGRRGTPVPAGDPWRALRGEMERLFERFGMPSLRRMFDAETPWPSLSSLGFAAAPPIDMSEDEKSYKITAELPGLEAKDVDVSVTGDMLVLKGEKRQEKEEQNKNYHFSERSYGAFQRAFELPASVDRDHVAAEFAKGVLTITLPKTAQAQRQAKKIEVKSS